MGIATRFEWASCLVSAGRVTLAGVTTSTRDNRRRGECHVMPTLKTRCAVIE